MKFRGAILGAAIFLLLFPAAHCQTDSIIHVNQFPGITVGDKTALAMLSCPAAPVPCYLIIDASLAAAATGTMPSLPANAQLVDFRTGWPGGGASNVVPRADTFSGADFCAQLRAANLYAVAHALNLVDATHFGNTLTCASDPVSALDGQGLSGPVLVTDLLPAAKISTTVPWVINNGGITLRGMGKGQTILAYTGASTGAILSIGFDQTALYFVNGVKVEDMSIVGGNANATDAVQLIQAGDGVLTDVFTWGVTGCGIHTLQATSETFLNPTTAWNVAQVYGVYGAGYSVPASAICLDKTSSGGHTGNVTIVNPVADGLSGVGFHLIAEQGATFIGGTGENDVTGLRIETTGILNSFLNVDFETNSANTAGDDVNDLGYGNIYKNVIAQSACTSCQSVVLNTGTSQPSEWELGDARTGIYGNGSFMGPAYNGLVFNSLSTIGAPTSVFATADPYNGNSLSVGSGPYTRDGAVEAGVFRLGSGTTYYLASSGLYSPPIVAAGTQGVAGCSLSNAHGGAFAGNFTSGLSGTCTVTVAPGITATNGWSCWAADLTTTADHLYQTASTTTQATISGTTASGDVITYGCVGF